MVNSAIKKQVRGMVIYLAYLGVTTLCVLLLFEGVLRVGFGRPEGLFRIRPLDGKTLYRPSSTITIYTGPIPYTVQTNALGFRGPEISVEKPAGTTRIIALGDSVTDGFYVDNEATYPAQLEGQLREKGYQVEVINAARGGATIDREMAIFDRLCLPLQPDMVVLTFVTNDIDDIRGISPEALVALDSRWEESGIDSKALWLASTALGELVLDLSLRARFENYRRFDGDDAVVGADRYAIAGNGDYGENMRLFMERDARRADSILLYETFDAGQMKTIENYLFALKFFRDYCRDAGVTLLFNYAPGYNQVHDPKSSMLLRDLLQAGCAGLEIPFLDLTPRFRDAVKVRPITLAPVDFHPNPYGNQVIAEEVGRFLESHGLSKPAAL